MAALSKGELLQLHLALDLIEFQVKSLKKDKANLKWCCEKFGIRFRKPTVIKVDPIRVDKKKLQAAIFGPQININGD